MVTYMNKRRERNTYPLVNIPSQPDLVKRLKYTKEILYQLIVKNGSDEKDGHKASGGTKASGSALRRAHSARPRAAQPAR